MYFPITSSNEYFHLIFLHFFRTVTADIPVNDDSNMLFKSHICHLLHLGFLVTTLLFPIETSCCTFIRQMTSTC